MSTYLPSLPSCFGMSVRNNFAFSPKSWMSTLALSSNFFNFSTVTGWLSCHIDAHT